MYNLFYKNHRVDPSLPLSALYRGGGVEVVRLLVRLGASISCADPEAGNTALHWAVAGGSAGSLASLVTAATSLAHSGTTAYTHLPWEARNNQEQWEKAELDPCFSSSFLLNTS